MNPDGRAAGLDADLGADRALLRRLLAERPVAALATLHRGEPAVSMTPFVLHEGRFVIHVSALSPHTADLRAHPRAALLVTAADGSAASPQALPRLSFDVQAAELARGPAAGDAPSAGAARAAAQAAYLARFPDAAVTFELADFTLFELQPLRLRAVAGFGRAHALHGEALSRWLADPPDDGPPQPRAGSAP